ncbi:hypothetical protein RHCRD62_10034 [Rhodococcus sp. RD6.2]|nr:hypothetical protein RHCRD62_10034 [Rhodococcus sp. RD6.2]
MIVCDSGLTPEGTIRERSGALGGEFVTSVGSDQERTIQRDDRREHTSGQWRRSRWIPLRADSAGRREVASA